MAEQEEGVCGALGVCRLEKGHDAFVDRVVWHWGISDGALKLLRRFDAAGWPTRDAAAPEEDL